MRGTMLWFNDEQDFGALRTERGVRIEVPGTAFAPGEKPEGRCAGRAIEFQYVDAAISDVTFVSDADQRRARMRHRR
jgi:hypothetical protein